MPAQIPIKRESTTTGLVDRYNSQRVGGAFDAKSIANGHHIAIMDSLQSAIWTPSGFKVKMSATEFKDKSLNFVNTTGFTDVKYKP